MKMSYKTLVVRASCPLNMYFITPLLKIPLSPKIKNAALFLIMSDSQVSAAVAKLYDTYPFPPEPILD